VLIFRPLPDLSPLPHLYENLDSSPCMVLPHHFRLLFFSLLRYATPPFLWSHDSDSSANDLSYLVLFFFSLSLWSIWVEWEFILMTAQ